jgi:hypothetical protein
MIRRRRASTKIKEKVKDLGGQALDEALAPTRLALATLSGMR